jgi:hypothetical protein
LVLDLYPPGTSIRNLTCGYCHVEQVTFESCMIQLDTLIVLSDFTFTCLFKFPLSKTFSRNT